jgi:hypothetical protein
MKLPFIYEITFSKNIVQPYLLDHGQNKVRL